MKRVLTIIAALVLVVACVGCSAAHTYMSWTFKVETGDNVKVKLDTTDGYKITSDLPFIISKDGETLSQGTFIKGDFYEQYYEAAKTTDGAKLLEEGEVNGHKYFAWSVNDEEWDYAILLKGGKTGILIGNDVSQASAQEVFNRLTITVEK
ncbi:MAG: hypothetical protein IJZ68_09410 [Bacteroidaceae bacterium]|nr:hypothetical protein [Bacteroidaceae bacterium]